MIEFFGSIWWLLVTLGILITFHEFGHFWVARRCGVQVLRFSVGFGRPLWRRVGRDGTEYVVAAIPLGGYVKMLDEREAEVPAEQRSAAFNNKPVGQRIAIVAAGPIANLIFAVGAFWLMYVVGQLTAAPTLGPVAGFAAEAGFREGDRIQAIDGRSVRSWVHASLGLVGPALDRRGVQVEVTGLDGQDRTLGLPLDRFPDAIEEERLFEQLGLQPWHADPPAVIGGVTEGDPAALAGLRQHDRILAIDGQPVDRFADLSDLLRASGGATVELLIERSGSRQSLLLRPRQAVEGDLTRFVIGVYPEFPRILNRYGPLDAVPAAFGETWRITSETLGMLWRMATGNASLKNVSGPITIARVSNDSARMGFASFLFFLGVISLSLAIINLLPIPILDGGHLLYYLIELVKGSPVSEQVQVAGQYVGLFMLASLMGLAFYNDIYRLLF